MIDRHLIVSKAGKVDNCLKRIHEKRSVTLNEFLSDLDRQESILFNLQMTIQNCIDIAAHIVMLTKLPTPLLLLMGDPMTYHKTLSLEGKYARFA